MKTRSQTREEKHQLYEFNIDFDGASEARRANKKSIGNGQYKYICTSNKNGIICGKSCYKDLPYCWQHRNIGSKLYIYFKNNLKVFKLKIIYIIYLAQFTYCHSQILQ